MYFDGARSVTFAIGLLVQLLSGIIWFGFCTDVFGCSGCSPGPLAATWRFTQTGLPAFCDADALNSDGPLCI